MAAAKPGLAVKSIKLSESATASDDIWRDYKGFAWIDPAASESWDYNIKIARDAWSRGFDEINFDYIYTEEAL
ncbi:MAG: GTP-binding protein [Parcubacteria group bacterium Gr01-1014_2]|nr:MAG: GTP-binding protein [Parcubacteria group bacterium Gr01-1014_2]